MNDMKKIIMITSLITLSSCGNKAPKCEDKKVTELVLSILDDNKDKLQGNLPIFGLVPFRTFKKENSKVANIMTTSSDDKLLICGCEGSVEAWTEKSDDGKKTDTLVSTITYTAQMNSEKEIIVKVNDVKPFEMKDKSIYNNQ